MDEMIHNIDDIVKLIDSWGILPFFNNDIPGFSLAEHTPAELWFPDNDDQQDNGVWDWKSDIIVQSGCAYGKLCQGKACFASLPFYKHLLNYRRSLYKRSAAERKILNVLKEHHSLLSGELKKLCGYVKKPVHAGSTPLAKMVEKQNAVPKRKKKGTEGFETALTHLQMGCYVVTADFEYKHTRNGARYGWGVARYCTPEDFFGADELKVSESPTESVTLLMRQLCEALPDVNIWQAAQFLKF